jgi:hypothetical protein
MRGHASWCDVAWMLAICLLTLTLTLAFFCYTMWHDDHQG